MSIEKIALRYEELEIKSTGSNIIKKPAWKNKGALSSDSQMLSKRRLLLA
jgi:hypothetical protein